MKRAKSTIPCQAVGSGEDVGMMAGDAAETDIEERKDQFLVLKNCWKTVFTRVQVELVYKSTPHFQGQKSNFHHF